MPEFNVPLRRGETLDLSGEFSQALGLLNGTKTSYFITGKAGTGKSTLLRYYSDTTKKRHALLAPTGLAAVNIGGETIHSFFHFPPEPITQAHIKFNDRRDLYKALEVLVIDEVSMVRADLMDGVDQMLRLNRGQPSHPFGGVQVLLFGDIFQLEPVVASPEEAKYFSSYYTSPFFFSAKVIQEAAFKVIDLQRVYRQRDIAFIRLLDSIRMNRLSDRELSAINSRFAPPSSDPSHDQPVTLTATNQQAFEINQARLHSLPLPEFKHHGTLEGEVTREALPAEAILILRAGSQVMFVKSDMARRWVNGTIGRIVSLAEDVISVQVDDTDGTFLFDVPRATWEVRRYTFNPASRSVETKIVGTYTQYPLKLAWAITVHKSQGLTFGRVVVDLGRGAFAHGQAYVALSRCTAFEGLTLRTRLRKSDIIVAHPVVQFYQDRIIRPLSQLPGTKTLPAGRLS